MYAGGPGGGGGGGGADALDGGWILFTFPWLPSNNCITMRFFGTSFTAVWNCLLQNGHWINGWLARFPLGYFTNCGKQIELKYWSSIKTKKKKTEN